MPSGGDGPQPTDIQVQERGFLPSVLTAHERNPAQEAEQAQKTRTRVEILQHRNKCCINMIRYINVITSSAAMRV